eukprot:gene4692-4944_t
MHDEYLGPFIKGLDGQELTGGNVTDMADVSSACPASVAAYRQVMLDMPQQQQQKLQEAAARIQQQAAFGRLATETDGQKEVSKVGDAEVVQWEFIKRRPLYFESPAACTANTVINLTDEWRETFEAKLRAGDEDLPDGMRKKYMRKEQQQQQCSNCRKRKAEVRIKEKIVIVGAAADQEQLQGLTAMTACLQVESTFMSMGLW